MIGVLWYMPKSVWNLVTNSLLNQQRTLLRYIGDFTNLLLRKSSKSPFWYYHGHLNIYLAFNSFRGYNNFFTKYPVIFKIKIAYMTMKIFTLRWIEDNWPILAILDLKCYTICTHTNTDWVC